MTYDQYEELREYRKLGTSEEIKEAFEKAFGLLKRFKEVKEELSKLRSQQKSIVADAITVEPMDKLEGTLFLKVEP
jgi:RNase P/RNase MRP subunit p30